MGNTKKEEETKRKGRSKRTGRKPSNYRYDKLNDAQKMKPDVRARKRADRAKREAEAKAEAEAEANEADADEEQEQPETTVVVAPKRLPLGPCCPDQVAIAAKNEQLLTELMRKPQRAFDSVTMRPDIIVIQAWFERKYRRHMPHFREYLREQNIRTTG
jgi:regulator of protease activity HflC (stomatin/prohibitin superfamily)